MDFIKDSAVKTVNGIKTEFAKTAKRERQNGETERQNSKTETDKTAKRQNGQWKSKRQDAKQWNQNGKMAKRSKRQTIKTVNGKTISFETENGNGQNGPFWSTKIGNDKSS